MGQEQVVSQDVWLTYIWPLGRDLWTAHRHERTLDACVAEAFEVVYAHMSNGKLRFGPPSAPGEIVVEACPGGLVFRRR